MNGWLDLDASMFVPQFHGSSFLAFESFVPDIAENVGFKPCPNGESSFRYWLWCSRELPEVVAALDANGYPLTDWLIAASLLSRLLTAKGRSDEKVRAAWFEFLLPIVQELRSV